MIIIDIADEIDLRPEKAAAQKVMPEPRREHIEYDYHYTLAQWHHRYLLRIANVARLLKRAHSASESK